jgi:hypothetical protein
MEAADGEFFFHHFYLRRISLWRAAGGRAAEHTGAEQREREAK